MGGSRAASSSSWSQSRPEEAVDSAEPAAEPAADPLEAVEPRAARLARADTGEGEALNEVARGTPGGTPGSTPGGTADSSEHESSPFSFSSAPRMAATENSPATPTQELSQQGAAASPPPSAANTKLAGPALVAWRREPLGRGEEQVGLPRDDLQESICRYPTPRPV